MEFVDDDEEEEEEEEEEQEDLTGVWTDAAVTKDEEDQIVQLAVSYVLTVPKSFEKSLLSILLSWH